MSGVVQCLYRILFLLSMSIFPHPAKQQSIELQAEEYSPFGCCFTSFRLPPPPPTAHSITQRRRFHSEPRQSNTHKIDLTIGKRRLSHTKTQKDRHPTESKERIITIPSYPPKPNPHQPPKTILNIQSKINTHTIPTNAPKVSFNKGMKLDYPIKEERVSWTTTNHTQRNQFQQQSTSKQDFTSLPFISQISLVEEEFVSHGSESLQALNFITQMQMAQKKQTNGYVPPLQLSRITEEKESRSSVSRLVEFRKENTGSGRKCSIL